MYTDTNEGFKACKSNHERHNNLEHEASEIDVNELYITNRLMIANSKWSRKDQAHCRNKIV